jgi:hypothetical protein
MFVICSTGARNEWGAKIALQIDFELKKPKNHPHDLTKSYKKPFKTYKKVKKSY